MNSTFTINSGAIEALDRLAALVLAAGHSLGHPDCSKINPNLIGDEGPDSEQTSTIQSHVTEHC